MPEIKPITEKSDEPKPRNRILLEWAVIILILVFLKQTGYGTILQSYVQRGMLLSGILVRDAEMSGETIGPASYNVSLLDMDGNRVDMTEWKGKTIFINVWATWCSPCLAEMPVIHDMYKEMADEDIVFAMFSSDESIDLAKNFVEKKGYTFPVYYLRNGLPEPYSTGTIPTTFVVNPAGEVVMRHVGMFNYNSDDFKAFLRRVAR
jgi:thiol-disulfide isomerase/thioredoxin